MELLLLYAKLIVASSVGMFVQLMVKSKSLAQTAKVANIEYTFWSFIKKDKPSIAWTFLSITALFLVSNDMIDNLLEHAPTAIESYYGVLYLSARDISVAAITLVFLTAGYMGQDLLLRVLSRTSKEMKAVIDKKTTEADTVTQTLDKPTPLK